MTGGAGQKGRIDAAVLRERMAEDAKWFAERHAELDQMRRAAEHYTAIANELRSRKP